MSKKKGNSKKKSAQPSGPTRPPFDPPASRHAGAQGVRSTPPPPTPEPESPKDTAERTARTLRTERMALRPNETYSQEIERHSIRQARYDKRAAICLARKDQEAEDFAHEIACRGRGACENLAHIAVRGVKLWDATHHPSKDDLRHLGRCEKEAPGLLTDADVEIKARDAARLAENKERSGPGAMARAQAWEKKRKPGDPVGEPFVTLPVAAAYCDHPSHLYPPRPIEADVEHCCVHKCYSKSTIGAYIDCVEIPAPDRVRLQATYQLNPKKFRASIGLGSGGFAESSVSRTNHLGDSTRWASDATRNIFDESLVKRPG